MITSVYLSKETIQVISGKDGKNKISIDSYAEYPAPEGSTLNGIITNPGSIVLYLKELQDKKQIPGGKVHLVIDSSTILLKTAPVPILSQKKLLQFTKDTFAEVAGTYDDLLYDYAVLQSVNRENNGGTILCSAVERRVIEGYEDVFSSAGLPLCSVDVGINCAIQMVRRMDELKGKTFMICILDGNTVIYLMFVDGEYSVSKRNRLFEERGTKESSAELVDGISSMFQFHKSQKIEQEITDIYLCGLCDEEIGLGGEFDLLFGVSAGRLPNCSLVSAKEDRDAVDRFDLSRFLYVVGNLIGK